MQPSPILQRSARRLALTTKQAGKDYYKGTRTGAMGRHTKHGGYIIDWSRVRTYVCPPDMDACPLTPFVAKRIEKPKQYTQEQSERWARGREYLQKWKMENGFD